MTNIDDMKIIHDRSESYRERVTRENTEAGNVQVPFTLECLFNHRQWITKSEYDRFTTELKTFLKIKE
jgi:hypothetical protein